jgi:hypothetical protein
MRWVNLHLDDYYIYWKVGDEMSNSSISDYINFRQPNTSFNKKYIPIDYKDNDILIDKNGEYLENKNNLDFSNSPKDGDVAGNNFFGDDNNEIPIQFYFNSGTNDLPKTESGKLYDNIKIFNGATQNITIKDGYDTVLGDETEPTEIWRSDEISEAFNGASFNEVGLQIFLGEINIYNIVAICFPPFTLVETDTGLRQIGDLKKGDLVKTSKGLIPLTKNVITNTPLGAKYVKFPKSFFSENVPERDLYVTGFHPFSLGLKEGTDDVYNGLEAKAFLGNIEGIEEIHLDTKTYHNLIFYDMEEFSVEGMKVYSHHPNGFPYKLPENEYLNEVNKEERKLNLITWNDFIKNKPDDVELKKFISDKLKF